MAVDETIFVPDIGFRPAEVVLARLPVARAQAGRTVTVERAVSGPSGVAVRAASMAEPAEGSE